MGWVAEVDRPALRRGHARRGSLHRCHGCFAGNRDVRFGRGGGTAERLVALAARRDPPDSDHRDQRHENTDDGDERRLVRPIKHKQRVDGEADHPQETVVEGAESRICAACRVSSWPSMI